MLGSVHERKVSLPSGGSIVIDTTEALTSIDVNSGKSHGERDIEDLALKTNLEAVRAIARQLRLRDIGGLIVLDLIDMRPAKNRKAVEQALKEQLKKDKAKTDIAYISKFGMLEMSRERMRPSVRDTNYTPCAVCGGKGHYPAPEFLALSVLRKLQEIVVDEAISKIAVTLPVAAANYLLNAKRAELLEIEKRTCIQIVIEAGDMPAGEHRLVIERQVETQRESQRESPREPAGGPAREHVAHPQPDQQRQDGPQPKKKRRRKRKRGGRGGEQPVGNSEQPVGNSEQPVGNSDSEQPVEHAAASAESMSVPAPEQPEGVNETDENETVSTAEAARSRKRRRPRRKRRPAESGAQAIAAMAVPVTETVANASDVSSEQVQPEPAQLELAQPEPEQFEQAAPQPSAPKRRRRPPRRKPAAGAASEASVPESSGEELSGE
jgi:ribonuclease E